MQLHPTKPGSVNPMIRRGTRESFYLLNSQGKYQPMKPMVLAPPAFHISRRIQQSSLRESGASPDMELERDTYLIPATYMDCLDS